MAGDLALDLYLDRRCVRVDRERLELVDLLGARCGAGGAARATQNGPSAPSRGAQVACPEVHLRRDNFMAAQPARQEFDGDTELLGERCFSAAILQRAREGLHLRRWIGHACILPDARACARALAYIRFVGAQT